MRTRIYIFSVLKFFVQGYPLKIDKTLTNNGICQILKIKMIQEFRIFPWVNFPDSIEPGNTLFSP